MAWRQAREEYREARRRLDKLDAERRLWELEIVLIRDHELTLPPVAQDRTIRRRGPPLEIAGPRLYPTMTEKIC